MRMGKGGVGDSDLMAKGKPNELRFVVVALRCFV